MNWMSNFDIGMRTSTTTAEVLRFGGQVIKFTKSGSAWQLVSPLDIVYQLAASGTGFQFLDPATKLVYTFSQTGALTQIQDRNGNAITLTTGADGPTQISDGLGRTLTLVYTGGLLTGVNDQAGRSIKFAYLSGQLSSSTDPLGNVTKYVYTAAGGLLAQQMQPSGRSLTTQTYDSTGRVIQQSDPNNNAFKLAYDGNGGTTITSPVNDITKNQSDSVGNIATINDSNGGTARVTYDGSSRRTRITDKLGNKADYTFHPQTGFLASVTDMLGNTTSYTYLPQTQGLFTFFNVTGIAYPDSSATALSYDAMGNLLSLTGPDGAVTKYAYDASGRVTGVTDAKGQSSSYAYGADSTMTSSQDSLGNKTGFTWDGRKLLTKVNDPNGGLTSFTIDDRGSRTAVADPAGAVSTTTFDGDGRRTKWVSPLGGAFGFTYTPTGKLASLTDPLGNVTAYTYDAVDRLASTKNASGETVSQTYDAGHRIATVTNLAGAQASYTYDAEGRMTGVSDGAGRKTSYSYDAQGQLTQITAATNKTTFAYDKRGRLISTTNPLGETETIARDLVGRVSQFSLPGGISSSIKRDLDGNVASIMTPNGNTWALEHDALARVTKVTDPLGSATSVSYVGDQVAGETLPLGTVVYTTDKDGRVVKRLYSDGTSVSTTFDAAGLVATTEGVTIQRNVKGQPTSMNGLAVSYSPTGQQAAVTYAPNKTVTYAYDNAGRISTVSDWVGGKTTLTYDGGGLLTKLTYPNGVATSYGYDSNGRLVQSSVGTIGSIALTRDGAGKIMSADRNFPMTPVLQAGTEQFTYDAAGRISSAGTATDKMGRVTVQNGRTYTWNLATQLTGFVDGANSGSLSYDGLGEISSSTATGTSQTFVFNYAMPYPSLSIVRQKGGDLRYYVYAPAGDLLYSIEASDNSRHFYHFDEIGNTICLTGENGSVTDTYAITPYGEIADHGGTTDNPFTWQGRYGIVQEARGLYYMRDRHYDASAARFVSRDPIMTNDPRASEPYSYARGNPLMYVDPLGLGCGRGSGVARSYQRLRLG